MSEEMIDMRDTVEIKSDQLNAEDLLSGPITITITGVKKLSDKQQPIAISFDGDKGKPWKPCKGMRVLLMAKWGINAALYKGRKVTIYNDPSVKWAGEPYGGIRVSHMDNVDGDFIFPLTISKGKKIMHKVGKLETKTVEKNEITADEMELLENEISKSETMADLATVAAKIKKGNYIEAISKKLGVLYANKRDEIRGAE